MHVGFIEDWKDVLTKPKEVFAKRKKDASIGAAAKTYAILGGIVGLFYGLLIAFLGALFAAIPGMEFLAALGLVAIPIAIVLFAVLEVIGTLIGFGILYVIAKLLGGSGDFKTHYYLPSLYVLPLTVLMLVLAVIPFLGALVNLVLLFYSAYLLTMAFKEAHGLSTLKAALVWLLPVIVLVLFWVVMFASLLAMGGAARG